MKQSTSSFKDSIYCSYNHEFFNQAYYQQMLHVACIVYTVMIR